ncbi:cytochrome P450 [Coniophora puteana RWD-64-598 SS2]|uniref:Cytochrome P450 n=1 Tax=Coniophora puteana (strain RWD-64-598) TaxID=741705 RepID=A0A5M3MHF3_CONPW|nr:cytochrome P450 [Coniophora puteana RWD-64-598 SS2]EIW78658.1 cytochrome P450 [Coniophora puteana RWD-64-598 SS2]
MTILALISNRLASAGPIDVAFASLAVWLLLKTVTSARRHITTTKLRGPAGKSWMYGVGRVIEESQDSGSLFEQWEKEYGHVYTIPHALGSSHVILCDPKAATHMWARDTMIYDHPPVTKIALKNAIGEGVLSAAGESHKRQRKALSPAFSHSALRKVTPVFVQAAYKVVDAWTSQIETADNGAMIEVQGWMNHISLDSIGLAGFSHDFEALDGKKSTIGDILDMLDSKPSKTIMLLFMLGFIFPWLINLPVERNRMLARLNESMEKISLELLDQTRREKEHIGVETRSVLGLLLKAENIDAELHLSPAEILAEMKVLMIAGYETTAASMTWALVELAKHPDTQAKLRDEVTQINGDPTYDQLHNSLPYLDAVVHEILRLHPSVPGLTRQALEDDVIPLTEPIEDATGNMVNSLTIAKGTLLTVSINYFNQSEKYWGADAKQFRPERWLGEEGVNAVRAKELQGHRHLQTFSDGPRTCLGRQFALTEFKAVLAVLVRAFAFELRDGPSTKVELTRGLLPRAKVSGEEGLDVPLRVRRID